MRGVILLVNVKFRRAWFISYKFILNKQNLLIMLFPFSLWSEFHFSPAGHGLSRFPMTWISFFSCRSWPFRVSHGLNFIFFLQVMAFPGFSWPGFHFSSVGHGLSGFPMAWISFFSCRSCSFRFSHDSMVKFSLRVILSRAQGKEILHSAPFDKIHIILLSNPILSIQLTWCKTLKHLTTYHF